MLTAKDCIKKYGQPEAAEAKHMVMFDVPTHLELGVIPKRVYCNRDLVAPLTKAFENIIARGLVGQLKTWDGCFNIRRKRGGATPSLHSWGVAIDINAAWNRFGHPATMSKELVACFKDAGFDWGGDWSPKFCDGMHLQASRKTLGLE